MFISTEKEMIRKYKTRGDPNRFMYSSKRGRLHEEIGSIFHITMEGRESTIPNIDSMGLLISSIELA